MNFISCDSFKNFQKYITLPYDCLCLSYKTFRMYLWNILKRSKLMLSHDPPKDSVTQLISRGAWTRSHSQAKMKPSCCFGDFFWIFQFCVISAGYLQSVETNDAWFSKKGSEWKVKGVHRKAKIPTLSEARNQEGVRNLSRKSQGKAPGLHSQGSLCIFQNGPSRDGELNWKLTRSLMPQIKSRGFLSTYYVTNSTRKISD